MSREFERYHRQMLLPGFGEAGQRALANSTALIAGCGALGTASASMLARAGVGHLVIIDRDYIELTNLQRQVLFDEKSLSDGLPKAEAAKRRIGQINSQVRVTAVIDDLDFSNIAQYVEGVDVIVDGLDNFETRYLLNDIAVQRAIPYLYGGAVGTAGMAFSVLPAGRVSKTPWERSGRKSTLCLRCLFDGAPAAGTTGTCDTIGVVGPVASIIANYQAAEALKVLTSNWAAVSETMLNIDLWANTMMQLRMDDAQREDACVCCGQRNFEYLSGKLGSTTAPLCGRDAVQIRPQRRDQSIDFTSLRERLSQFGEVRVNEFMLRAELRHEDRSHELSLFADGRAIIKGTDDPTVARAVYAKYVGS